MRVLGPDIGVELQKRVFNFICTPDIGVESENASFGCGHRCRIAKTRFYTYVRATKNKIPPGLGLWARARARAVGSGSGSGLGSVCFYIVGEICKIQKNVY